MVGDGFRVHHFFPGNAPFDQYRLSPFLMLDYNAPFEFPKSDRPRGVDVHPHKGFETVSIVFEGQVAHYDSAGNQGVIGPGEVQWMTAGRGILHKEFHEEHFSKSGGVFHMAQLWVNLPSAYKLHAPRYQDLRVENIPVHKLEGGTVKCFAGELFGIHGPANTFSPMHLAVIQLEAGAQFEHSFPDHYNLCCLMVEGTGTWCHLKDPAPTHHLVVFHNDGKHIHFQATSDAKILLMAGEPIEEPIVAYGPFVMNTHEEIQETLQEYRAGKFGRLE